jgi:hypothetical protein
MGGMEDDYDWRTYNCSKGSDGGHNFIQWKELSHTTFSYSPYIFVGD